MRAITRVRSWAAKNTVPRPLALLVAAGVLVFLAGWIRVESFGLTVRLYAPGTPGADVMAIDPKAPAPAGEVASYVGPLRDETSMLMVGNMLDGWPKAGLPDDHIPEVHALFRGSIDLPSTGTWRFSLPANGSSAIAIDGEPFPAEGKWLPAGTHAFQLVLQPAFNDLDIGAGTGKTLSTIPAHWLLPEGGVAGGGWMWLLAAAGAACAAAAGWLLRRPAERERTRAAAIAMAPPIVVLFAALLGTLLRAHHRLGIPRVEHTWDEYYEAFHGLSLVLFHSPTSWAGDPTRYPGWQLKVFYGRQMGIVHGFVDYPPLFALLVGLSARLSGATDIFRIPLGAIRRVPLLLSIPFYPLVYAIGRRAFGRMSGAAGALMLAVCPAAVVLMKFAKSDLLVALLLLVSIWAAMCWREAVAAESVKGWVAPKRWIDRPSNRWLVLCGLAAGLCPWAKQLGVFGLVVPPIMMAPRKVSHTEKEVLERIRPSLIALGIAGATIVLLLVWEAAINWGIFLGSTGESASRMGGFHLGPLFTEIVFLCWQRQQLTVFAGGWVLMWMSAFWAMRGTNGRLVATLVFVYLAELVSSVDGRYPYGWYQIPAFGLLAVTMGAMLWRIAYRPNLGLASALLCIGVLPFGTFLLDLSGEPGDPRMTLIRRAVLLVCGVLGLDLWLRAKATATLARIASGLLVAGFLGGCVVAAWQADYFYWVGTLNK